MINKEDSLLVIINHSFQIKMFQFERKASDKSNISKNNYTKNRLTMQQKL